CFGRQDSQRSQAREPARRAADEVRTGHQPSGCKGAGTDDPAVAAAKGGYGDPMTTGQHAAPGKECPRCRRSNPAHAKFCLRCGGTSTMACPRGATDWRADASFCLECGDPVGAPATGLHVSPEAYTPKHLAEKILTSKAALEGERKQVTVLFAD